MKKILIIAGPNGAGKTTFAQEFLPNEADCPEFVNADLIAAGLSPFRPEQVAFAAGRLMMNRISALAAAEKSFALETTLSTRSFLRLIPEWQRAGYRVELYFLKLPDADFAIRRVAQRVRMGGHNIPKKTIRRRFDRGWKNLQEHYLELVDTWSLYDSSHTPPLLLQTGQNTPPPNLMEDPAPYQAELDAKVAGAQAALNRASAKAIAQARAAGLEPVTSQSDESKPEENTP